MNFPSLSATEFLMIKLSLPWILLILVIVYYVHLERFFRRKFIKEREVHVADVKIEKTEREPNDKEDNFPNKTVTELPESVQKFPESVQKFPESDKNLQDSIQNFGESVTDSVKVRLPITQKVYEDSICKVWVSGYNPKVDSVNVFQRRVYYPVAMEKGREDPKIVITIGPYMGFGNKGFNYGIALNIGVPLSRLKWW